eukprot:2489697-Pyramimonas_sp.AAC.1
MCDSRRGEGRLWRKLADGCATWTHLASSARWASFGSCTRSTSTARRFRNEATSSDSVSLGIVHALVWGSHCLSGSALHAAITWMLYGATIASLPDGISCGHITTCEPYEVSGPAPRTGASDRSVATSRFCRNGFQCGL